mgnify:CR=1 FL=1
MEINAKVDYVEPTGNGGNKLIEPLEQTITLTIDGDSRTETWETLVNKESWGAFEDIDNFDCNNLTIQKEVDSAVEELRQNRLYSLEIA